MVRNSLSLIIETFDIPSPDQRAQLERGKSATVKNVECTKFVVANSCKRSKNAQQTMMFVWTPRTYSVDIAAQKIPPFGPINHPNMNGKSLCNLLKNSLLRRSRVIAEFTFEGFFGGSNERKFVLITLLRLS